MDYQSSVRPNGAGGHAAACQEAQSVARKQQQIAITHPRLWPNVVVAAVEANAEADPRAGGRDGEQRIVRVRLVADAAGPVIPDSHGGVGATTKVLRRRMHRRVFVNRCVEQRDQ